MAPQTGYGLPLVGRHDAWLDRCNWPSSNWASLRSALKKGGPRVTAPLSQSHVPNMLGKREPSGQTAALALALPSRMISKLQAALQ